MSTDEKPTVEFDAVPDWAVKLTERMIREFTNTNANISTVANDVTIVKQRVGILETWKATVESTPSVPPPLTSMQVRAIADEHPSKVDLAIQAAQAEEIIKGQERDRKIAETHALAESAAAELAKQSSELAKQSRAMGIGVAGLKWVVSKEGRATMTQLAILVGVLYGILKSSGVVK